MEIFERRRGVEMASAISLGEAYFCLNCEVVTNCSDTCPVCGHKQLWLLENWLGRVNGFKNNGHKEDTLPRVQSAPTF
jgi:hypothetical protein